MNFIKFLVITGIVFAVAIGLLAQTNQTNLTIKSNRPVPRHRPVAPRNPVIETNSPAIALTNKIEEAKKRKTNSVPEYTGSHPRFRKLSEFPKEPYLIIPATPPTLRTNK